MCVSTGITLRPKAKHRTIAAVLGPTPGRLIRYSRPSVSVIVYNRSNEMLPKSSLSRLRTAWILGDLLLANPPRRMVNASSSTSAVRTSSHSPYFARRSRKALPELISDVCCDRIQPINSSTGPLCGCQLATPYNSSSLETMISIAALLSASESIAAGESPVFNCLFMLQFYN